jgi:hypothetical protein
VDPSLPEDNMVRKTPQTSDKYLPLQWNPAVVYGKGHECMFGELVFVSDTENNFCNNPAASGKWSKKTSMATPNTGNEIISYKTDLVGSISRRGDYAGNSGKTQAQAAQHKG